MKRILIALTVLLLLTLCLPGLAEGESAFAQESIPEELPRVDEWSWRGASQFVVVGDSVYALYPRDGGILRWAPGEEGASLYYGWEKPEPLPEGGSYVNLSGERRVRWDGQVTYIFPWKDRLWGLNVYTRRVGEISAEGIAWQGQALDLGHWVKNLNQGGWLEEAASVFQEADRLCVAYNVSDMMGEIQFDYALLVVDLATGQARSVDTGLGQSVVPYKPGQALALGPGPAEDGYQYQLRGIDVVSGAVRDLHIGMPPYRSGATLAGLAYDRERDIIYYHDGSRAHLSQQSGAFTPGTVLPLGAVRGERPGLVLSDGRYGVEQEGLLLQAVSPGGAEGYLKLQLDFASASPTYRAYRKARPEAKVLLSEGRMTAAQVVTDMQGRTEPIDIYQLRVQSDFSAFKDKGYAAALDDDAPLRQAVDAMYPFMREALQDQQGRLVAVPASIQIWHDAVAPENYALFFQGQPYPETWQEYLTQLYQFEEQSPGKSEYSFQEWMTYDSLLVNLLTSYIQTYEAPGEALSFDRPELKAALDLLVRARDLRVSQGQSLDQRIDDAEDGVLPNSIYFPRGSGVNTTLDNSERTDQAEVNRLDRLKPLSFVKGESPVYRALLEVYVLNPASQNREQALDFLRFAVQRETEPKYHLMMRPDDKEPVIRDNYEAMVQEAREGLEAAQQAYDQAEGEAEKNYQAWELARVRALATEPEKNKWLVSPGSIADYRSWADQIRTFSRSPYLLQQYGDDDPVTQQLKTLSARYLAGQMDQAGFLRTLNETFRLIYLEQQ